MSFSLSERSIFSSMGASPSTSLVAANRTGTPARWAWSSMRWQMAWMHRCTAPEQKSSRWGFSRFSATCMACSMSSSMPSFLAAEMGMTGMPRACSRWFTCTVLPLARISSIMFSASTMGMPSSMSCKVR